MNDNYESPDPNSKRYGKLKMNTHFLRGDTEMDRCKQGFFDFFVECMNKFAPEKSSTIKLKEATDYIDEWVELHFEEN
jgi:hypothetical protein